MSGLQGLAGLVVCGSMAWASAASADAVTDWNEIAMAAVTVGRPGPVGSLDTALVQAAVHDAVQAIDQRFEPYHVEIRGARGNQAAAVAAAAHATLVGLYPAQAVSLDATFYDYLAAKGLGGDPGLQVGQQVAAAILPLRRQAPDPLPPPFVGGTSPGTWRPTDSFIGNPPGPPAPFSPMVAPWMAVTAPFTLTSPARFRAAPPPAMTSELYRTDYHEVKTLGSATSSVRTPEQTDLAYFYNDNIFTQWHRALRAIAAKHVHNLGDSARLFALASLATADSVITAWHTKTTYVLWRPLTAIQEAEHDGNPHTISDPAWRPLVNNPNYPEYSSGANSVTAAMTRTLALYFRRDRLNFEVTSLAPQVVQRTRHYSRFSEAAQDVVDARVYQGIHFRFADTVARDQGSRVAEWTFSHSLLPLDPAARGPRRRPEQVIEP